MRTSGALSSRVLLLLWKWEDKRRKQRQRWCRTFYSVCCLVDDQPEKTNTALIKLCRKNYSSLPNVCGVIFTHTHSSFFSWDLFGFLVIILHKSLFDFSVFLSAGRSHSVTEVEQRTTISYYQEILIIIHWMLLCLIQLKWSTYNNTFENIIMISKIYKSSLNCCT